MLVDEVLIFEFGTVNAFSSRSVVLREISTLRHEAANYSVERGPFEVQFCARHQRVAALARAQTPEVFCRLRNGGAEQFENYTAHRASTDTDVEKALDVLVSIFLGHCCNAEAHKSSQQSKHSRIVGRSCCATEKTGMSGSLLQALHKLVMPSCGFLHNECEAKKQKPSKQRPEATKL